MVVVVMQLTYNNKDYDIVINKKFSQKNTYIRVKKDLKVTVTTNYFVTNHSIEKLIKDNYERICKIPTRLWKILCEFLLYAGNFLCL